MNKTYPEAEDLMRRLYRRPLLNRTMVITTVETMLDRRSHEITSEPVKPVGVGGIGGGLIVNSEAGISPRKEQVDALLGDELAVLEEFENIVPEEELSLMGIDVGNGMPRAVIEKNPARV